MHVRHLLAIGALVLGAASCAQILGDDFRIDGDDDETGEGSTSSGPGCDSCDGCAAGSADACCANCSYCACASEVADCDADQECADFEYCFAGCGS